MRTERPAIKPTAQFAYLVSLYADNIVRGHEMTSATPIACNRSVSRYRVTRTINPAFRQAATERRNRSETLLKICDQQS